MPGTLCGSCERSAALKRARYAADRAAGGKGRCASQGPLAWLRQDLARDLARIIASLPCALLFVRRAAEGREIYDHRHPRRAMRGQRGVSHRSAISPHRPVLAPISAGPLLKQPSLRNTWLCTKAYRRGDRRLGLIWHDPAREPPRWFRPARQTRQVLDRSSVRTQQRGHQRGCQGGTHRSDRVGP